MLSLLNFCPKNTPCITCILWCFFYFKNTNVRVRNIHNSLFNDDWHADKIFSKEKQIVQDVLSSSPFVCKADEWMYFSYPKPDIGLTVEVAGLRF